MRIAAVLGLIIAGSLVLSGADCDSVIEVVRDGNDGQIAVRNISHKPLIAYVLVSAAKSKDGTPIRTYSGVFSGQDSLAPGESMKIGKADPVSSKLLIDYVRFADSWTCGDIATPGGKRVVARFAK